MRIEYIFLMTPQNTFAILSLFQTFQISPRRLLQRLGDPLGIAVRPGIIYNQHLRHLVSSLLALQFFVGLVRHRLAPFVGRILPRHFQGEMAEPAVLFRAVPMLDIGQNFHDIADL